MVPQTVKFLRSQWRLFTSAHPLAKGVATYAVLWPTGSLIQQTFEGRNYKNYDWLRCLRFGIFGALYVAPTLYGWVRLSSAMWPQMSLRIGLVKAVVEQFSYGPFACVSFFVGMSVLELKSFDQMVQEVRDKAFPTYKVGVCVWPIIQTINFAMVPERNRVIFVSFCSLIWTTFLAFMNRKDMSYLHVPHEETTHIKNLDNNTLIVQ